MATAKLDKDGWFRCSLCGHILGKKVGIWNDRNAMPSVEIKCSKCKTLNYLMIGGQGVSRNGD